MSNLKMVALVEGEEIVVGRCHPGQARLLQKKGLAEFREGKVWLKEAPPMPPPITNEDFLIRIAENRAKLERGEYDDTLLRDLGVEAPPLGRLVVWPHRIPPGWTLEPDFPNTPEGEENGVFSRPLSEEFHRVAKERLDFEITGTPEKPGIDPEGIFSTPVPQVETRRCETLAQWLTEIRDRRAAGHTLLQADDPRALMLGFVDDEDGIWFGIGLVAVKMGKPEVYSILGNAEQAREGIRSAEGRAALLGYAPPPEPEGELPDDLWDSWVPKTPHPSNAFIHYSPARVGDVQVTTAGVKHHHVTMVSSQHTTPHIPGWCRFLWPDDAARMATFHTDGSLVTTEPPQGTKNGYLRRNRTTLCRLWVYPWDPTGRAWLDTATANIGHPAPERTWNPHDYIFQKRTEHATVAEALAYWEHPELAEE